MVRGKNRQVFVGMGHAMPDGSPALLKTLKHLRREKAEEMWRDLLRNGWEKVPAVWGADEEPWLVPVLTKEFRDPSVVDWKVPAIDTTYKTIDSFQAVMMLPDVYAV